MPTPTIFEGINPRGTQTFIPCKDISAFPRSEQAVLGAKNVFDYSKAASSANTAYTATNNGKNINLTSITNGTYRSIIFNFNVNKNTEYRLSTNVTITSGHAGIKIQQTDSTAIKTESITSSGEKTFTFNSGNNEVLQMVLFCTWSTSEAGNVDYNDLIIQLATDPDDTYVPYAMTNRELTTDSLIYKGIFSNVDLNNLTDMGIYVLNGSLTHSPDNSNYGTMFVVPTAGGGIGQIYVSITWGIMNTRRYYQGAWDKWYKYTGQELT